MMPYKHTKFQVETQQGAGPVGKKDLAKIWNLTENHQKWKKSNLSSKFRWESRDNFFFRFWTRFDPLLAILLVLYSRAYVGEPG